MKEVVFSVQNCLLKHLYRSGTPILPASQQMLSQQIDQLKLQLKTANIRREAVCYYLHRLSYFQSSVVH